jgi:hypothetical protein
VAVRKRENMGREIDLLHFVEQKKISLFCAVEEGDRSQWVATGTTDYVKMWSKM